MTKFAVHNFHTPAVEINDDGSRSIDGATAFMLPEPIYTAPTFKAAEKWRKANQPAHYAPRATKTLGSDRNQ